MLRTSKRKKPNQTTATEEKSGMVLIPDDDDDGAGLEDDDIMMFDSDNEGKRPARKRPGNLVDNPENSHSQQAKKNLESFDEDKDVLSDDAGGGFMRRSQRQRKPVKGVQNAIDAFDELDEAFNLKKGGYKRRVGRPSLEDADAFSNEERYGLRGRKKRQKFDDPRENIISNKSAQNSLHPNDNHNEFGSSGKNPHVIMKRNEKNGIVCAVCWKPETFDNPCLWFCQRYCQRSFHDSCKDKVFSEKSDSKRPSSSGYWECDDCAENIAECFCCKKKGVILVFPKKGKPKAAGSGNF